MAAIAAPYFLSASDRGTESATVVAGNGTNGAGITIPRALVTYQQGIAAQNAPTLGYPT